MIPLDLKPGAVVRCVSPPSGGTLRGGHYYTVIGYHPNPGYSEPGPSVLLREVRTSHTTGDHGGLLRRFELIRDGDGSDWQGPNDCDLGRAS